MAEKKPTVKKKVVKKPAPKKAFEKKDVKYCQHCGAEMNINAEACNQCGKFTIEHKATLKSSISNVKIYKVLSYFGILWLIGLLCNEKENKELRFHVGQGMLVTILIIAIEIINSLIIANVFVTTRNLFYEYTTTSAFGFTVMYLLRLIPTVLAVIGIINAFKDEQKELPVIGKYAFYK